MPRYIWPARRFVVEQESMLPNVHHQHWIETRHVARLMKRNPVIGESPISGILVTDGPTNPAHLANTHKIRLPDVVAAEALCCGTEETRGSFRVARTALFHVAEIVFVQDHAVVFEPQAAREFGVSRHFLLIDFAVSQKLGNLVRQLICLLDVTLVEFEVHLQGSIGDAIQATQIELFGLV